MPLIPPPDEGSERILVYGGPKVGKTSAWISVAQLYQQTGTPGTFYVIDTDNALKRMLAKKDLQNVQVMEAYSWDEYRDASEKAVASATEEDWIVVDFVDRAWTAVRDWYFDEFLEEAPEEYFKRKKRENMAAGKGGKRNRLSLYEDIDWDVVNPEYNAFFKPLNGTHSRYRNKGHLFLVCEEKDVWKDGKPSGDTKPGGQGGLPYSVHSIIRLDRTKRGRLIHNNPIGGGDRERPELMNEPYESFGLTYLCKTAGWKVKKGGETDA